MSKSTEQTCGMIKEDCAAAIDAPFSKVQRTSLAPTISFVFLLSPQLFFSLSIKQGQQGMNSLTIEFYREPFFLLILKTLKFSNEMFYQKHIISLIIFELYVA